MVQLTLAVQLASPPAPPPKKRAPWGQGIPRGPIVNAPIRLSLMQTGSGDRFETCASYTACLDAAAKRAGDAHCPPWCHSRAEADRTNEHRHMAASRPGAGHALPSGWEE